MPFSLNLSQFVQSTQDPQAAPTKAQGLVVLESTIEGVITRIEREMQDFDPRRLASEAEIQPGSFGGADAAPNLAFHYGRAHEVTWKTLNGLKEDLEAFQEACRAAMREINVSDETSADDFNRTREVIEILDAGTRHGQGHRDHRNAQQNQDTTPEADI